MADLSKLKLPDNSEYDLKDATARSGLATKQDTLVSGTNIKTINNESILGSGNLTISGGDSLPSQTGHSGDILSTDGTDPYWMDVSETTSVSIDTTVTANSSNLITSGAVSTAISGKANTSHTHGNITSAGDITATAPTIASGDKLIINDESASKITNGPAFGSSTTTFLRNDGTWAEPAGGDSLPSQSGHSGDFLTTNGTAASWADPVATSTLTIDSTPTANSTNLVTSGGTRAAISELAGVTASWFNRVNAVTGADTNYTSLITRGEKLLDATTFDAVTTWSSQLVNGSIAWRYE